MRWVDCLPFSWFILVVSLRLLFWCGLDCYAGVWFGHTCVDWLCCFCWLDAFDLRWLCRCVLFLMLLRWFLGCLVVVGCYSVNSVGLVVSL